MKAAAALLACATALAFPARAERTLEELKAEAQARADRNAYPLTGLRPEEVREALGRLKTMDRDEWAASWSEIGDRYRAKGDYEAAWKYYSFARWPQPNSPGKQKAYEKALEAYLAHARRYDPPLQLLRVPYEGSEVVALLRLPKGAKAAPLVIAIAGLDSRKEELMERFRPFVDRGIGVLALDSPGTGQSGVKVVPGAEKSISRVMDAVLARPEVDPKRVVLYGGSFGGYWAAVLAVTERSRLRAVAAQSPLVHVAFDRSRRQAIETNREYLFDYVPAWMFAYGVGSMDELLDARERMSLKARGLLDQPAAPMLVIAGVLDTQVPFADAQMLMSSGDVPKEFWVNPRGGHMGRDAKAWPDPVVFKRVTMPWLLKALEAPPAS
ncbi:MAG TPA: alpha/beta fold hydrolase [Usitatibacter sp.]|nr:alpha/beta fold hydrolase [Usitatibacter sp.]